jgi:hypothetical protein
MRRDTNMAAGVPTTGIGGLYYLLLALAIGICKLLTKLRSIFHANISRNTSCFLMKFPTVASIVSVGLIIYMNVTGFRITLPGSQPVGIPSNMFTYLGLIGGVAITFFTSVLALFHIRANRHAVRLKRDSILSSRIVVPLGIIGASLIVYLASERIVIIPLLHLLPFDPLSSTILVIIHVGIIICSLKLTNIV